VRRPSRSAVATVAVAGGAIALHAGAAVFFASHDPYHSTVFAPCPILALTGFQCPSCGGTRAMYSLLHGDLAAAWQMNPFVLAMYPVVLGFAGSLVADAKERPRLAKALSVTALVILCAGIVYAGVIRNLLP
jgi:hypothetical protein